jgi:hypothetical protein
MDWPEVLVLIAILSLAVLGMILSLARHRVLVGVAEIEGEQIDLVRQSSHMKNYSVRSPATMDDVTGHGSELR